MDSSSIIDDDVPEDDKPLNIDFDLEKIKFPSLSSKTLKAAIEDPPPQAPPKKRGPKKVPVVIDEGKDEEKRREREEEKEKAKREKEKKKQEKEKEKEYAQRERETKREEEEGDELLDREELLRKIQLYYSYFPSLKTARKFTVQSKMGVLESELRRCQTGIKSDAALENVKRFDIILATVAEVFLGAYYPVRGLKEEAERTQDIFENEYKELAIEYEYLFSCGPEFRYLMKFVQRILKVIKVNATVEAYGRGDSDLPNDENVKESVKEKYKNY